MARPDDHPGRVRREPADNPKKSGRSRTPRPKALLARFDPSLAKGRAALAGATDAHPMTDWRLMAAGHLVNAEPRYLAIRQGASNHLAHHRGQLASVPAIYGPSADEGRFA